MIIFKIKFDKNMKSSTFSLDLFKKCERCWEQINLINFDFTDRNLLIFQKYTYYTGVKTCGDKMNGDNTSGESTIWKKWMRLSKFWISFF